jgi:hypothetical protein
VGQQHQPKRPSHLAILGQLRAHHPGQPDRLVREVGAVWLAARGGGVARIEDQVEHVQEYWRWAPARCFALGTGLVAGSVPPQRAGSAASMSETGNYFGGSLGFALLGVVAAVVYRSRMDGTSDSLAGAVVASQHLPASQGADLLHTAREAFTASLHVTGVIAAVIFAGLAVLILTMRPATRTTPAALPDYEATRS